MQGWIEVVDGRGETLLRRGTGVLTAVVPIGDPADGRHRAEILCDAGPGRPRAIRITVHPTVLATAPAFEVARHAEREGLAVEWTIRWTRHDWVPVDLPVTALDLATDTAAVLEELAVVGVPAAQEAWSAALWQDAGWDGGPGTEGPA